MASVGGQVLPSVILSAAETVRVRRRRMERGRIWDLWPIAILIISLLTPQYFGSSPRKMEEFRMVYQNFAERLQALFPAETQNARNVGSWGCSTALHHDEPPFKEKTEDACYPIG